MFILICHLLKLLTPSNFWILKLIANILSWPCSDTNCCEFKGSPPQSDQLGRHSGNKPQDLKDNEKKRRRRYYWVKNANTQYNVVPPIKQIICTSTEEGGETLLNFREYNKNYLHLSLRRLQTLNGRQEQRTLMVKLLSWISHLDELHS